VKYLWALIGVLYVVLNVYVGYLFIQSGTGARLSTKGILLQAPPVLGGIALIVLSIPLLWNCFRLVTARVRY
jgi:hypothetical protein